MDKVFIEVRVNEFAMKQSNPNVPYGPDEIAREALACRREGASMVHYHARDPQTGAPVTELGLYSESARRIREQSDLLFFPTLGAWTLPSPQARMSHIVEMAKDPRVRLELAPMDMGTNNVDSYDRKARRFRSEETIYLNSYGTLRYFAETMRGLGVRPVVAIWNVAGLRAALAFVEMGLLEPPLYIEFVLTEGGNLSGHPGTVRGLQALLDFLPHDLRCEWSVLCFGGSLMPVVAAAIERGGNISIGLGDYHYREMGTPTNAELVARVAQIARDMGREVASPAETRAALGLSR